MRTNVLLLLLLQCLLVATAPRAEEFQEVQVADPYIEMHTGPGRGYPIFYSVERGASISILKRRTDWFKVRTTDGKEGWVHRDEMVQTLGPSGERLQLADKTFAEYQERSWELGILGGDFEGADVLSLYGGYHFTQNLSVELWLSAILGDFSDGFMANVNLQAEPFPEWRLSPFVQLGTGVLHVEPHTTLVQENNRTDQLALAGFGVRFYITRSFIFRAEYNKYVIFMNKDNNEDIDEWKAGVGFFF